MIQESSWRNHRHILKTLLIFDSDCGFCLWLSSLAGKVLQNCEITPYQKFSDKDLTDLHLTKNQCGKALQLVHVAKQNPVQLGGGGVVTQGEIIINKNGFTAVSEVLEFNGRNRIVRYIGKLLNISLINYLGKLGYVLVARNRGKIKIPGYAKCKVDSRTKP